MDNDKQINDNPQLRMLNNMGNQTGFSNNGATQGGSYGYPVNNFNSGINNQNQANNQGINYNSQGQVNNQGNNNFGNMNNQNTPVVNSSLNNQYQVNGQDISSNSQGQVNNQGNNNLENMNNQNTPVVNNPFGDNNIETMINQQSDVLGGSNSPFNIENSTDPRKKEMNDNNFEGNNLEHGFVDVLKEGGVNVDIPENKFIDNNKKFNETSINDLNIDGSYNKMSSIDYSNDPQVIANIQESTKKNTVKISKELQTFFLIAMILLAFIFVMPYIFDLVRDIKSR